MKVLQVIHSVNPQAGGTTEGLKQLCAALMRLGVEVDVLCLDAPEAPWLRDFPCALFALGPGRGSYGYTPRALPWLLQHAADYDLIAVNGLWQYGGFAVWRAWRKTGVPYVVIPHGMLDPWFKRHYPLKHLKKWLYWPWAEYRVLRDAAAVLFTAEEERIEARKSFWLYRCREKVIGFGIDAPTALDTLPSGIFLEKYPALAGKRLILFLGRMHEKKGCDLLLRAWARVMSQINKPEADSWHLVMAGPHDHPYGVTMRELCRELHSEGSVTWTGMVTGDLKWSAFQAAGAFVLPSHQENFGVSVVEALASGRPVLISDKVNIWREVADSKAGLVEPDDLDGTIRLLTRWISLNNEQRKELTQNSKPCFEAHFQMTEVAQRFVSVLDGAGIGNA